MYVKLPFMYYIDSTPTLKKMSNQLIIYNLICIMQLIHLLYCTSNTVKLSRQFLINEISNKSYYTLFIDRGIPMKLISWNVNGLRACVRKGFLDYFNEVNADIFCVQEIKLQEGQIDLCVDGYEIYWNYALKKGYSGTAIFTKHTPISVQYGLGEQNEHPEGRIITMEFNDFFLVNVYSPNAQRDLTRLELRLQWEDELFDHIHMLEKQKPVILCGDLNVAHQPIDIRNAKANEGNSGFTLEERAKFSRLLDSGFVDTLRYFHPKTEGLYTWWSYMKTVRERNIGWRIDYFIVSQRLIDHVKNADIDAAILGSDHCPILLEMNL